MDRHRWVGAALIGVLCLGTAATAQAPVIANVDPLTGPRSRLSKDWLGTVPMANQPEILVLAGHADSQGIGGAGTAGAAVDLGGAKPMRATMRDELHWNLLTAQAVVSLGQRRGLAIRPCARLSTAMIPAPTGALAKPTPQLVATPSRSTTTPTDPTAWGRG